MKGSFVMYTGTLKALLLLPHTELRQMLTAILDYQESGKTPKFQEGSALGMAWSFIGDQFQRDAEKWAEVCKSRKEAGRKGGLARAAKQSQANQANACYAKQSQANQASQAENENDTDIKESILTDTKEKPLASSLQSKSSFKRWSREELQAEIQRYPEHFGIVGAFLDYWTEPDPSGKMRFQLEKTWETGRRLKRWAGNAARPWANAGTPSPVCDPFSKDEEEARRKELGAFE